MNFGKALFIGLGTISLSIGIIGIVVPGLPTTPFLLLTAYFYVRSSDKLFEKVISNRLTGSYIKEFRTNKGMTLKAKLSAICMMWGMILLSCFFFIDSQTIKLIITVIGIIGTIVMGLAVPTIISKKNL